jgi:hypothetical protein
VRPWTASGHHIDPLSWSDRRRGARTPCQPGAAHVDPDSCCEPPCGPCAMSAPSQGRQRARDYASAAAHPTEDKQSIPSFIGKLSIMLQEPTSTPYVKWADGGDSIVVTDPTAFATAVLPRSFRTSRMPECQASPAPAICLRLRACWRKGRNGKYPTALPLPSPRRPPHLPVPTA